jgi:transcriptional regulator with XRE-family HTH domain
MTVERLRSDPAFAEAFFDSYVASRLPLQLTMLRYLEGFSQGVLSKKLGMKQAYLSRLEHEAGNHLVSQYERAAKMLKARLVLVPSLARLQPRKKVRALQKRSLA